MNVHLKKRLHAIVIYMLVLALHQHVAFAEETSILDTTVVTISPFERDDTTTSGGPFSLIDGSFRNRQCIDNTINAYTTDKEIAVYFPKEVTIVSAFVVNRADSDNWRNRFGASAIYAGTDRTTYISPSNTRCTLDFSDTTFPTFTGTCKGDTIAMRRIGAANGDLSGPSSNYLCVYELRLYQIPNILVT